MIKTLSEAIENLNKAVEEFKSVFIKQLLVDLLKIKYFLLRLFNKIRFFRYSPRCERCGYPMEASRPYYYDMSGELEASYYYQCGCHDKKLK